MALPEHVDMLDLPMYPLTYGRVNREIDETPSKFRVLALSCHRVKVGCSRPINTPLPKNSLFKWCGAPNSTSQGLVGPAIHFTSFYPPGIKDGNWKSSKCTWLAHWNLHLVRGFSNAKFRESDRFSIPGKESHQLDTAASGTRWRNGAMAAMWGLGMGYIRGNVHGFIHWKPLVSKFKWQLGIHYFRKPPCGLVFWFRFETCQCWYAFNRWFWDTLIGCFWNVINPGPAFDSSNTEKPCTEGMTGPTPGVLTINVDFKGHKKPFGPGGQHSQHPKRSGWVSVQSCESG